MHVMRTQTHSQSSSGSSTDRYEATVHTPVLLQEVLNGLSLKPNDVVLDGTLGLGGHAKYLVETLSEKGMFIGIDQDADALVRAEKHIGTQRCTLLFLKETFAHARMALAEKGVTTLDGVLLDLGWGSHTLESGRGFSFNKDEPLVMTYDSQPHAETLTASDIVNTWSEDSIIAILQGWGEESYARRIAQAIVSRRIVAPIETTGQLALLIEEIVPRHGKTHPATKTFQALRIAVNNELEILSHSMRDLYDMLTPGGKIAVITFHSLEDRIIKRMFKELSSEHGATLISKKAIQPQRAEVIRNPRARSSKLRLIQKPLDNIKK
jgi:16S rRNA (cytosine1402-N4)-methyltransferase